MSTKISKGHPKKNRREAGYQSVNRKNRIKEDTASYIYSFPKLIIRGLCAVSLIYVVGTIVIIGIIGMLNNSKLTDGNLNNIINNLAVIDLLSVGIAIVAIAVSVWVGLNVYNFISRDEIKEVTHLIKGQKNEINDQASAIREYGKLNEDNKKTLEELSEKARILEGQLKSVKDLALQEFISAISRSGEKYIISSYFADFFRNNELEFFSVEVIYQLTAAEVLYDDLTEYYEKGRLDDCYETSPKVQKLFETFKQNLKKLSFKNKNIQDMIFAYLDSRIADTLFYKNVSKKGDCFTIEMTQVATMFEGILETIKDNEKYKEAKACQAYCYNTIGYTYDQLYSYDNKKNAECFEKARDNCKKALDDETILPPRTKARYYRNLGLTYDHNKEYKKALEKYRKAVEYDISDYKGWITIASAIIKIIESETGISKRTITLDRYNSSQFKEYSSDLKEAKKAALFCMRLNPAFADSYNKLITISMFQILSDVDDDNKKKAKEQAEEYIQFLDKIKTANGFLFAKRNYYEAIGDINTANEINKTIIKKNPQKYKDFDCLGIEKIYKTSLSDDNDK